MKWAIPLGTGGVILAPLIVVSIVSGISPYFILDNPDFWYGYMGYVGTVALAGAALWQNQSFRLESRRKEEYAIRPYLFSKIEDIHIDFLADHTVPYLQVNLLENGDIFDICENRNKPQDVQEYILARQQKDDFLSKSIKMISVSDKAALMEKELNCLLKLKKKYEFMSYCLENHGAGSAVKIFISMNGKPLVPLFCLSHGEKVQLYFLINAERLMKTKVAKFNIAIEFYNIEDFGPYRQEETFSICKTETEEIALIMEKQISSPVLEKKEATTDDKT